MTTYERDPQMERLMEGLGDVSAGITLLQEENARLRGLLAAYVADEDRYNNGHGEPYGSISTETGILARAALKRN